MLPAVCRLARNAGCAAVGLLDLLGDGSEGALDRLVRFSSAVYDAYMEHDVRLNVLGVENTASLIRLFTTVVEADGSGGRSISREPWLAFLLRVADLYRVVYQAPLVVAEETPEAVLRLLVDILLNRLVSVEEGTASSPQAVLERFARPQVLTGITDAFAQLLIVLCRMDLTLALGQWVEGQFRPQRDEEEAGEIWPLDPLGSPARVQLFDGMAEDLQIVQGIIQSIGWRSRNQFKDLWELLSSQLNVPEGGGYGMFSDGQILDDSLISVEHRRMAIMGLTSMLRKVTETRDGASVVPAAEADDGAGEEEEKDDSLRPPSGRTSTGRPSSPGIVDEVVALPARPRSRSMLSRSIGGNESDDGEDEEGGGARTFEIEYNTTHFSELDWLRRLTREVLDAREQSMQWKGIDLTMLISSIMNFLGNQIRSPNLLLRKEAIKSILVLSDLFGRGHFQWMLALYHAILAKDTTSDVRSRTYLALGMCKAIAVLNKCGADGEAAMALSKDMIADVQALVRESAAAKTDEGVETSLSLRLAGFRGLTFLVEARVTTILLPMLPKLVPVIIDAMGDGKPSRLQTCALQLAFLLMEKYPKECEEKDFTRQAIDSAVETCSAPMAPFHVCDLVFAGFGRLLTSFSLSQQHRQRLLPLTRHQLHAQNFNRRLLVLNLMFTSMFSAGNKTDGAEPSAVDAAAIAEARNSERQHDVLQLLRNVRVGGKSEEMVSRVLPQLLLDVFQIDQLMTLLLSEFLSAGSHPVMMVHVLREVFQHLVRTARENVMLKWALVFVESLAKATGASHVRRVWGLTCVFLAAARNKHLRCLFAEAASHVSLDEELVVLAATDFYDSYAREDASTRERFLRLVDEASEGLAARILALLDEEAQ